MRHIERLLRGLATPLSRSSLLVLLLLMIVFGVGNVQSQALPTPLFLWSRGDLFVVNDLSTAPTRLTDVGTISGPALSPDGMWIAYKAASPLGIDALSRVQTQGLIADFDLPANIYAYNIAQNAPLLLAGQPADASLFDPAKPDNATLRSAPTWSPDGSALAWIELDYPSGARRLMRYDLLVATLRKLADLPTQTEHPIPPSALWGEGGIAVNFSVDASSDQLYYVFDGDSGAQTGGVGVAAVPDTSVRLATWVHERAGGRALFGLLYESGGWALIDPANNTPVAYTTPPALTGDASGAWALHFGVDSRLGFYWEIVGTNSAAASDPNRVALSPDGQHLAIAGIPSTGTVSVFDGANMSNIPGTGMGDSEMPVGAVMWGAAIWVLG